MMPRTTSHQGDLHGEAHRVVAGFFDQRAERYDGAYIARGSGRHILNSRLTASLTLIGDGPGEILDVGMGPGRLCAELAARGWTVSGVDISAAMVSRAQTRVPTAAHRLHRGAVEQLPFADESFDVASVTGVFEYVRNLPAALEELVRVLRPRGRAVISIPNRFALYAFSRRVWDPVARSARRAVDPLAAEPPRGADILRATEFTRQLERAGLELTAFGLAGALVVPAPVDSLMPIVAERLATAVEGRRLLRGALATQLLFATIKRGGVNRTSAPHRW
jgi:ubiquinone/menaquinone biosynthesis C-methylase UbiE